MTFTVAGEGTVTGAWYRPFESIRPTVSLPPVTLFTCQMVTEFVPPVMASMNCWVVTTFTETVAGEIVTLIFVTGSVQVDVEVVAELVVVLVVQVTAVLAGAAPQEDKPKRATSKTRKRRRFTATLYSLFYISDPYGSASTPVPKCEIIT